MTATRPSLFRWLLAAALLPIAVAPASRAQSLWSTPYVPNQIALEALHPTLQAAPGEEISVLSGAATLWGSHLVTDRTTVVVGLPVAQHRSTLENGATTEHTETVLGNPYIGIGVSSTRVPLLVELGARLPLASDDNPLAARTGRAADLTHREAFAPHQFAAQMMLNTRWEWSRTLGLRLRGGPLLTVPTQEASGSTELYARYGLQGWYEGDQFIMGLGLTGRAVITERGGAFRDRTTHQVSGTLILNLPRVQPGLILRTPINGLESSDIYIVVGATLSVTL